MSAPRPPNRFRLWLLLIVSVAFLAIGLPFALWSSGLSIEVGVGAVFWLGAASYSWKGLQAGGTGQSKAVNEEVATPPESTFGVGHLFVLSIPLIAGGIGAVLLGASLWGKMFAFLFCGGIAGIVTRFVIAMLYDGGPDSIVVTKQKLPGFEALGQSQTAYSFDVERGRPFRKNQYREAADAAMGLGGLMLLLWVVGVGVVFFQKLSQ